MILRKLLGYALIGLLVVAWGWFVWTAFQAEIIRTHVDGQWFDGLGRPLKPVDSWILKLAKVDYTPGWKEIGKDAGMFFGMLMGSGILAPIAGSLIGVRTAQTSKPRIPDSK